MIRRHIRILRVVLMASDALVAAAVLVSWYGLRFAIPSSRDATSVDEPWAWLILYAMTWVVLLYLQGEYRLRARWTLRGEIESVARATVLLALVCLIALLLTELRDVSRLLVVALFPIQFATTVLSRAVLRWAFEQLRLRGRNHRYLLIVGTGPEAIRFAHLVEGHAALGLRVAGFLGAEPSATQPPWPWLGEVDRVLDVLHDQVVDEVAVCLSANDWPAAQEVVELCIEEGKIVRFPLDVPSGGTEMRIMEDLDGTAVLSLVRRPDQTLALAVKRAFDIVVASVALIVLSPVLMGIALYIRHKDGTPVLYRQVRVGMHGRQFTMLKFRSMVRDADARYQELRRHSDTRGPAFKLADDPRVTEWGHGLRRSSLDELPQLINVLRGDMSIVGPRPAPPREVEGYDVWHRRRLSMKPGMTGLWQVGERLDEDFDERARLDLDYIDRWSFWLDLRIVARTVPAVLRQSGR